MLRPSYKVEIGSDTYELGPRSPLLSIYTDSSMDVSSCSILKLNDTQKTQNIKQGDKLSIKIGYEDKLKLVFNGIIVDVGPDLTKILSILSFDSMKFLIEKRINKVYENQTAGKIVEDLVSASGIKVKEASDGLSFPYYFVDDKKIVFHHIMDLAKKCGFDFYLNTDNEAIFKQYERSKPKIYEYAKNIINAELFEVEPSFTGVTVQGESPSSFKGADTAHWLSKSKVEGIKGEGTQRVLRDPVIRDKDTADKVAEAIQRESTRILEGYITVVGDTGVEIGDTIEIKGMDNKKMNGEFQVRGVNYILSDREGFTTRIYWRK
ncbi:hypothetical protein FJY84_02860 [Candidatus Bathyarchaeota archaeon]|nr:hypothetical protein [Candidatus Bathyarchaeota archaeon]